VRANAFRAPRTVARLHAQRLRRRGVRVRDGAAAVTLLLLRRRATGAAAATAAAHARRGRWWRARRRARRARARALLQRLHGARARACARGTGRREGARRGASRSAQGTLFTLAESPQSQLMGQAQRARRAVPTRRAPRSNACHGRRRLPRALLRAAVRARTHAHASAHTRARALTTRGVSFVRFSRARARREDASGAAAPRWAFLENAGGSRVPDCVAEATAAYMKESYVQARAHARAFPPRLSPASRASWR
jgi:hypothetical protein